MNNKILKLVTIGFCSSFWFAHAIANPGVNPSSLSPLLNSGSTLKTGVTVDSQPVITGTVSPFQLCLQPKTQSATAQEWAPPYVTKPITTPFCMDQTLSIADFNQLTDFEKDLFTATSIWQSYMKIDKPIKIDIYADSSQARIGATPNYGAYIPRSVPMPDGTTQNYSEAQPMALTLAKTSAGQNVTAITPTAAAIDVFVNLEFVSKSYCFDAKPTVAGNSQCSLNAGLWDVTSVFSHELGHGFGILSLRNNTVDKDDYNSYGTFAKNVISTFDFHTNNAATLNSYSYEFARPYQPYYINNEHFLLFTGENTQNYLSSVNYSLPPDGSGTPNARGIPICNLPVDPGHFDKNSSQNFSHFGINDTYDPASNVVNNDLMGLWINWNAGDGQRLNVSTLDLKVMEDLGYSLRVDVAKQDPRDIFAPLSNNKSTNK